MRLTLKNRTFAAFAAVILLFAFSSVLFIEFYVRNMLREETIEDGRATASMIAAQVSQLAYAFDLVIVALTLANFLATRLSRPISNLTETASLVTSGALSGLPAVESDDEIGELAASFNERILAIRAREQELRDANVELETVNVRLHQYIIDA